MRIRELALRPFRNFDQLSLAFGSSRVLIAGRNGRGKSNILEAISFLSIGKSTRGVRDQQAVPHGGDFFDIRGGCDDGRRDRDLRIYFAEQSGKKAFCDGTPLPRVSDVIGIFQTVHFSSEDVSLVLRFPAQRRRVLDILISQSSGAYLRDLQRYRRLVKQRNHLLSAAKRAGTPADEAMLRAWGAQLAQLGAAIRHRRLEALGLLAGPFADYYCRVSGGDESAGLDYRGPQVTGEEELRAELEQQLREKAGQERRVGHTLCGPHRDDLVFLLNEQPADSYASEGQLKTILIAWKMAEARLLEQLSHVQPVLLLDDVFSELDALRVHELLGMVDEFDQVIATTPQEPDAPLRGRFEGIHLPD